jgi:hemolysin III
MFRWVQRLREPFCGLSHWFGALLAVAGTVLLLIVAKGDPTKMVAFSVYGATLIFLFVASSLYHSLRVSESTQSLLRKFDHVGIFLLISGTYVPVCLLQFSHVAGAVLLTLQAVCASVGILGTFLFRRFPEILNVVLYLAMGWMSIVMIGYMRTHWPAYAVGWLVAGGIAYTVGAVIFSLDKPNLVPGKFSAHDLWHVFVLAGSACHFALMWFFVAPRASVV